MMSNPFETLGLAARFDLDEGAIESAYLALAAEAHPDRYSDPLEQADAAERASAINQARQVLLDPESRARALLEIRGGRGGGSAGDETALPPAFLMEVMEIRERMEEAIASGDAGELEALRAWATRTRSEHLETVSGMFASETGVEAIRKELNALRYVQRMLDQMPEN